MRSCCSRPTLCLALACRGHSTLIVFDPQIVSPMLMDEGSRAWTCAPARPCAALSSACRARCDLIVIAELIYDNQHSTNCFTSARLKPRRFMEALIFIRQLNRLVYGPWRFLIRFNYILCSSSGRTICPTDLTSFSMMCSLCFKIMSVKDDPMFQVRI